MNDLSELIQNTYLPIMRGEVTVGEYRISSDVADRLAAHLIANDVTIQKHSKRIGFPNNGVWDLKCDNCHRIIPFGQTPETMHYCPLCGAKMLEGLNENLRND